MQSSCVAKKHIFSLGYYYSISAYWQSRKTDLQSRKECEHAISMLKKFLSVCKPSSELFWCRAKNIFGARVNEHRLKKNANFMMNLIRGAGFSFHSCVVVKDFSKTVDEGLSLTLDLSTQNCKNHKNYGSNLKNPFQCGPEFVKSMIHLKRLFEYCFSHFCAVSTTQIIHSLPLHVDSELWWQVLLV